MYAGIKKNFFINGQANCLCIKLVIICPLAMRICSPADYCEPNKFQIWTEDVKSDGTAGVQEGKVPMGFSGPMLVVLNLASCIS